MVRNTRVVSKTKIWLPKDTTNINTRVVLNGDDITDYCYSIELTRPTLLNGIQRVIILLHNPDRYFIGKYFAGDNLIIYADYSDGTSVKFNGKIETPTFGMVNGYKCRIYARQTPELSDKRVNFSVDGVPANEAIRSLITNHYSGIITLNGLSSDMQGLVYISESESTGINIIVDILTQVGYDGRIETNNDLTTFPKAGESSSDEHISEGVNLIQVPSYFGGDSLNERNRIKVYGKTVNNIDIMWTSSDQTSIARTWAKDLVVRNTNLETINELKAYADSQLELNKDEKEKCRLTVIGMSDALPGKSIPISIPGCNINDSYFISEMTDTLAVSNSPFWTTVCQLNENEPALSDLFKKTKNEIDNLKEISNPNNMESTAIFLKFLQDESGNEIESLTDCELSKQKLKLVTGQSTGTMISSSNSLSNSIRYAEIRAEINDDCDICEFYASNNNGKSYKKISSDELGDLITFDESSNVIRLKIIIKSDGNNLNPEIASVGLFIKE